MPTELTAKRNKTYLELLRIMAMLLVLFNHTWIYGFTYFNSIINEPGYWFSLFFSILVKIDVPIFFMISGALLLSKEESLNKVFERFGKTLIALVLFSFISYIYGLPYHDLSLFSATEFIKALYQGSISGQYWYLYRYLGFLLLLPILRPLVKNISNKTIMYIVALYLTVQCVTIIQYAISKGTISYNGSFDLFILQDLIIFPIVGYFMEKRLPDTAYNKRTLWKLVLMSILSISVCCIMTRYHCTVINEWSESSCQVFFNTLIIIPTSTIFYGIKMLFMKHSFKDLTKRIITTVGSTVFGIYLLEQIYREETFDVFTTLNPMIGSFFASIIWILCAFLVGFIITLMLKKIPYLNKII